MLQCNREYLAIRAGLFGAAAFAGFFLSEPMTAAADGSGGILTHQVAEIAGPRRSILVGPITASGPITTPNDTWDVTAGLATMLTTALVESNRFVVVERATLPQLQVENNLAATQASSGAIAAAQPAHVVAAQYFVTGMVTDYGSSNTGSSIGVGSGANSGGGIVSNMLGIGSGGEGNGLSLSRTNGKVSLDLRVISTQTGVVVGAFTVTRDISSTNVGITTSYKGIPFGLNQFWNTPIGQATREALTEATNKIALIVAGGHWQGQIAEVDGNQVIVNAGRVAGVKVGDQFTIERVTKSITDPATAEVLGAVKEQLGRLTITDVQDKYSTGSYSAVTQTPPQRGDFVVMAN
jgi:curli biogenesis system outer membrane secretion channel CsgG